MDGQEETPPEDDPSGAALLQQLDNDMVLPNDQVGNIVTSNFLPQDPSLSLDAFLVDTSPTCQDYSLLIDTSAFQQEETSIFSADSLLSLDPFSYEQTRTIENEESPETIELAPTTDDLAKRSIGGVSSSLESPAAGSGFEAFQRTPLHYNPASSESLFLDEALNVADVEAQILESASTTDALQRLPIGIRNRCGAQLRDAVLLLAQTDSTFPIGVLSFPSAESLDVLLQHFLHQQMLTSCSFIHVPSFDPRSCRTELLSVMIASAASRFDNPQIAKMGLALQERIRVAVHKAFNRDGALARALDMAQASILWIETGLWSGVGRMMEVAESAAYNVPTVG